MVPFLLLCTISNGSRPDTGMLFDICSSLAKGVDLAQNPFTRGPAVYQEGGHYILTDSSATCAQMNEWTNARNKTGIMCKKNANGL